MKIETKIDFSNSSEFGLTDKISERLDKQLGLAASFHNWGSNKNKGDAELMLKLSKMHMDGAANIIFGFIANRFD